MRKTTKSPSTSTVIRLPATSPTAITPRSSICRAGILLSQGRERSTVSVVGVKRRWALCVTPSRRRLSVTGPEPRWIDRHRGPPSPAASGVRRSSARPSLTVYAASRPRVARRNVPCAEESSTRSRRHLVPGDTITVTGTWTYDGGGSLHDIGNRVLHESSAFRRQRCPGPGRPGGPPGRRVRRPDRAAWRNVTQTSSTSRNWSGTRATPASTDDWSRIVKQRRHNHRLKRHHAK